MSLIILFIVLLLLSAFFSGTETAYFNIKTHRESVSENIQKLLKNPRKLLVTLLTGNTIVNIVMASLAAILTHEYAENQNWSETMLIFVEVGVVTTVILIFGEIIPKLIAIRHSEAFAKKVNLPLRIIIIILYPIAFIFYNIMEGISKLLPMTEEKIFDSEEELKILTELGEEEGTLQEEESDMIQSIFEFKDKFVREIMVPRVDMIAIDAKSTIDEVMDIVSEKQYSKIPIYKENKDNIKGIVYAKDILPYLTGSRPNVPLKSISRPPFFVPETKLIDDLMKEFKQRKTNIAIVVDEWGGTSGLITLEDIVEEVLGEIRDPFDKDESPFVKQGDGSFIIDARISIYDLEEELDIEFPEEREYDTLAGLILHAIGDIPSINDNVKHDNLNFTVKTLNGNRIDKVHLVITEKSIEV